MSERQLLPVVAIDGPVGVGKSTIARRVAEETGLRHIDTGAMYRAVALRVMELSAAERADPQRLGSLAREMPIDLRSSGSVLVAGVDVSVAIRHESVSQFVSYVADSMEVREALVEQQRRLGSEQPSILEGRDIGTVVFPDAALKIFLDAAPRTRVQRRVAQLDAMGASANEEEVLRGLLERDARDRSREWGALRLASDARYVDTTNLDEAVVVSLVCSMIRENPVFRRSAALTQ